MQAAVTFVDELATLQGRVTADPRAMLRHHSVDRQIAELNERISFNPANAMNDNILPTPTEQTTFEWARDNLAAIGWTARATGLR